MAIIKWIIWVWLLAIQEAIYVCRCVVRWRDVRISIFELVG